MDQAEAAAELEQSAKARQGLDVVRNRVRYIAALCGRAGGTDSQVDMSRQEGRG